MEDEDVSLIFKQSDTFTSTFDNALKKFSQENSCDEDSVSSCNSEMNWNLENIKGYENNTEKYTETNNQLEIVDYEMSDDFEDDDDFILGLSDSEDSTLTQLNNDVKKNTDYHCNTTDHSGKRKKPLGPYVLKLKCEWKNCSYKINEESEFHVHVSQHIPHLEIKTLGNGEEVYKCLWAECTYLTGGREEIQRHVTYHSYHTKLKCIGKKIIKEWNIPKCSFDTETRNMIPDKIDPMICEWKDCNREFNNVQVFLYHILMHVNESFVIDIKSRKESIRCKWVGCTLNSNMTSRTSLTNHMRTHTQEKVVGCPTCGHLFSTNTKLNDHCTRQLSNELSGFQCSQCYKYFANLRLLKDHMRGHVNFYKCCYCDMTCTSRHTFSAHIRYKHLDSKPFRCSMCSYACKTSYDLQLHQSSHESKPQFECEELGCDFQCRTRRTLQRHMIDDHHMSDSPVYCCHMPDCESRYKRGCYLTKHLMTKHGIQWPSGHSKFMYHRQIDGTYKLQTVRYESVKLCGENMSSSPSKANAKIKMDGSKSFKVSTIEPDSTSGMSQVLISIEDESGNTINCCTAPEVIGDKIPKNATVIATADRMECENEAK